MDRWAIIRKVAAKTIADYEVKSGQRAFTTDRGSHVALAGIAHHCYELAVTPDDALDSRRIGHLDDYLGITYWPELSAEQRDLTIAHELGHKALGHPPRDEPDSRDDIDALPSVSGLLGQDGVAPVYNSRDRYELEANVFAAELLAPVHLIREMTAEQSDWTLDNLANYFGLSREAMANQLATALLPGPIVDHVTTEDDAWLLDPSQQQAAIQEGATLVIAGPGAGKTRVLTARFKYLVEEKEVLPRRILALTFATKAADEMRVRLSRMLPEHAHEIQVSTFHSLGLQLLTSYGLHIGLPKNVRIATDIDALVLLRSRLSRLQLGRFEDIGSPTNNLRTVLDAIKKAKNELMGPEEYAAEVRDWRIRFETLPEPGSKDEREGRRRERERLERYEDISRLYWQYQEWLQKAGLFDYGDLLMEAIRLFDSDVVALDIRERNQYLLVDEFQDINYANGWLVQALDGGRNVTWAVGDPRQSIFRFQGASLRNLSAFRADYPDGTILSLPNNYRSVKEIVAAGEAVAFPRCEKYASIFPGTLTATRERPPNGLGIRIARVATPEDEYSRLCDEIERFRESDTPLGDIAILCRKREQAQVISTFLEGRGIPTNWSGILQNSPAFKDICAIIGLAADDPKALARLASMPEHALPEPDVRIILEAASKTKSLANALYRVRDGEIEGLSTAGHEQAGKLLELYFRIFKRPSPWSIVFAYLFELSRGPRSIFHDNTPEANRIRLTLGQFVDMARSFRSREGVAGGQGTREFLQYITLAIESGRLETQDTAPRSGDAVNILTMHGSKGLQWPIVFLPHMSEENWQPIQDGLAVPPFLPRERDELDSDATEEASLLYVAITRAKDSVIVLSSKTSKYWEKEKAIHPIIATIEKALGERGMMETVDVAPYPGNVREDHGQAVHTIVREPYRLPDPVPHRYLETYGECGLKFLFHHVYRLDNGESAFRMLTVCVRKVMAEIVEAREGGELPSDDAVKEAFLKYWSEALRKYSSQSGAEDADDSVFVARGLAALCAFRDRVGNSEGIVAGHQAHFQVEGRDVVLQLDEVRDTGSRWEVHKHYLTNPSDNHNRSKFFLALQLASENNNLRSPRVYRAYPAERRDLPVMAPSGGAVERYRQQLAHAIDGIESGNFEARPNGYKCRTCPFFLICPAS